MLTGESLIARMFVLCLLLAAVNANDEPQTKNVETFKTTESIGRRILDFQRNGVKVDVRVVLSRNDTKSEDNFPEFPTKDLGHCLIDFSFTCAKKRLNRFLKDVGDLDEITLYGQDVKLVKTRGSRSIRKFSDNDRKNSIEDTVNDFFDSFALRITLPRLKGRKERNQIDVMFNDVEGRGKGGGGGGGFGGGGGKGGGGKCKMMMMAMLMMVKMKVLGVIGVTAMKGMMMGGMSLMLSTLMLMQKFMKGGGGPWQSGGGGPWQGGGSQLKEIVLLTKSASGGGGGGGGGCCGGGGGGGGGDYGGYGPSGGGGGGGGYGGGGGGGWGRSFGRRFILPGYNKVNVQPGNVDLKQLVTSTGASLSNGDNGHRAGYKNHQDYPKNTNGTYSNLNSTGYNVLQILQGGYPQLNAPVDDTADVSENESFTGPLYPSNYVVNSDADSTRYTEYDGNQENTGDFVTDANQPNDLYNANVLQPIYTNEWETVENGNVDVHVNRINSLPPALNVGNHLQHTADQTADLLQGI